MGFLVLLDLSAAFDTVNHNLLLHKLSTHFKIRGVALDWIESYLRDRTFRVKCKQAVGTEFHLKTGVPQGSILGPLLFNCYTSDLFFQLESNFPNLNFQSYADDIQLLLDFNPKHPFAESDCRRTMGAIIDFIKQWMSSNSLRLNTNKTVFLPISKKHKAANFGPLMLCDGSSILPVSETKNLGVIFDENLCMTSHISKMRSSAFFHLRRLQVARKFIPQDCLPLLVHAFVTSRVDFCNSLYFGLPENRLSRLNSVITAAAKFLTGARKYDSSAMALKSLHWLPLRKRIIYKLATLGFHISNQTCTFPNYFKTISPVNSSYTIRTRASHIPQLMSSFKPKLKTWGDRSFNVGTVSSFNNLPADIRSMKSFSQFKSHLKTHLFQL